MSVFREYYLLTKPGIIRGNVLVATAAYFFGAKNHIDASTLIGLVVGTSCIIAAGCVVNSYFDRHIDKRMQRTRHRALVTGTIEPLRALLFAGLVGVIGIVSLLMFVNNLTLAVGVVGFVTYAFVYTFAKHTTVHATLIGTLPGATPPVAGYAAATMQVDAVAAILFFTMVAWQMAHFYAISLFRAKEYAAAAIPVMSVVQGATRTKRYIMAYIALFTAASPLLSVFGYASVTYACVMTFIGLYWLRIGLVTTDNSEKWARKIFGCSLFILLIFSGLLVLDVYLP
jgi:heme o synthase